MYGPIIRVGIVVEIHGLLRNPELVVEIITFARMLEK
jgi:hypothetical protein